MAVRCSNSRKPSRMPSSVRKKKRSIIFGRNSPLVEKKADAGGSGTNSVCRGRSSQGVDRNAGRQGRCESEARHARDAANGQDRRPNAEEGIRAEIGA